VSKPRILQCKNIKILSDTFPWTLCTEQYTVQTTAQYFEKLHMWHIALDQECTTVKSSTYSTCTVEQAAEWRTDKHAKQWIIKTNEHSWCGILHSYKYSAQTAVCLSSDITVYQYNGTACTGDNCQLSPTQSSRLFFLFGNLIQFLAATVQNNNRKDQ